MRTTSVRAVRRAAHHGADHVGFDAHVDEMPATK
jgi:hypothetical protein